MAKFTTQQLDVLKKIGHGMLVTASKMGGGIIPRASIVEPSFFFEEEVIIPVVQLSQSLKNVQENKNIFLHFVDENVDDYGWSTQYKINAVAEIETEGDMFLKAKTFEEAERLPSDMKVRAIIRAKITNIEVVVG